MEVIVGLIVIILLLLILGFGPDVIIFGLVGLLTLAAAVSALVLMYFAARLALSKRCSGTFTRIGKHGNRRYDCAYYSVDGEELPNVFPAEMVMKKRLYNSEKTVKLRTDRGGKFVYDRNARATILTGVPLTLLLTLFLALGMWFMTVHYP
ncbi:MAG: hypothetical protein J6N15_02035 [Ruminiclostridium sp.]|nr:hypothetical protein [Ruminiclostridium sp.]